VETQYGTALGHLHALERRWPERHYPYVIGLRYLAEREYKRGDLQRAEQLWRDAIENGNSCLVQRPDEIDTRVSLCWAYLELFNRVLDSSPDRNAECESILKEALDHAQIALQQRPHSSPVRDVLASLRVGLARCYCKLNRVEDAIPLFKSAVEDIQSLCSESPWSSDFWDTQQWFVSSAAMNLKQYGHADTAENILRDSAFWMRQVSKSIPRDSASHQSFLRAQTNLVKELYAADLQKEAEDLSHVDN
jgi:tetratricopeptide (TPR) repeat protein